MRPLLIAIAAALATLVPASIASASITPTITLDQSAGQPGGASQNLGIDLSFAPTGSDSPEKITLEFPPGLSLNTAIDGGTCRTSAAAMTACQVGSGTVADGALIVPATFDLVAPPATGDLAGLQLLLEGNAVGTPADISSGSGAAGIAIKFTGIPDNFQGIPVSVTSLTAIFTDLTYPSSCPSPPADVQLTAESYDAPTTPETASAPLTVTDCQTTGGGGGPPPAAAGAGPPPAAAGAGPPPAADHPRHQADRQPDQRTWCCHRSRMWRSRASRAAGRRSASR